MHQILHEAILIIPQVSGNPEFSNRITSLLPYFHDLKRKNIVEPIFDTIVYNRKTEHYTTSIELAKMLLLHYNPDMKNGINNILAILFDMNVLFEEYIFRQLKKKVPKGYEVSHQEIKEFWESQTVRPDIVITKGAEAYVLDTKWKVLNNTRPTDDDLKQMYVYHHYFSAQKTILIFPEVHNLGYKKGRFHIPKEKNLDCELRFVQLMDSNRKLNKGVGEEVWKWIVRS